MAYTNAGQTPFDFEEEEEDEKEWKQIQLRAAGISSSTSKLMNKKDLRMEGQGGNMLKNMLNSKTKGLSVDNAIAEEKRRIMQIRQQQMYISKSGELHTLDKMITGFAKPKKA